MSLDTTNKGERANIRETTSKNERTKQTKGTTMKDKVTMTETEYQQARATLRMLARSRDDFQSMRKALDGRIGRKADGEAQNVEHTMPADDAAAFAEIADESRKEEAKIEKHMLRVLRRMPIWNEWLSKVKGVGPVSAAWMLGEFDIYRANTVSALWQFCGLNPGLVQATKSEKEKDGTVRRYKVDEMIRGDRLTPGYVAPFNKRLRVAICGVMADGFIKAQNEYAIKYYYTQHAPTSRIEKGMTPGRLDREESMIEERSANGKSKVVAWKDAKDAHRHRAAIRYMVKMFLADLYKAWRPLHGLEVRPPYHEAVLGHKHHAA
jgi:hypothetical protein